MAGLALIIAVLAFALAAFAVLGMLGLYVERADRLEARRAQPVDIERGTA